MFIFFQNIMTLLLIHLENMIKNVQKISKRHLNILKVLFIIQVLLKKLRIISSNFISYFLIRFRFFFSILYLFVFIFSLCQTPDLTVDHQISWIENSMAQVRKKTVYLNNKRSDYTRKNINWILSAFC